MTNIRGDQAMARIVAAVSWKSSAGHKRPPEQALTKTLLWTKSRRGLLTNSNHITVKPEIPTHPPSQKIPIARPRRSSSHSR